MYGLEDEGKKTFKFDLEEELKKSKERTTEIIELADQNIIDIKKTLKTGVNKKNIDDLGILLHGYTSLKKVINKASKS
jgi:hypothetical protein